MTKEIEAYVEKIDLRGKLAFRKRNLADASNRSRQRETQKIKRDNKRKRKPIQELKEAVLQAAELSEQYEFREDDPAYQKLVDLVIDLSKARDRTWRHQAKPPYTDEKLAATLFWISLTKQTAPGLITRDGGIGPLMAYTKKALGAYTFVPHNNDFRQAIKDHQEQIYFRVNKHTGSQIVGRPNKIDFPHNFYIQMISTKENWRLEEDIRNFWTQLSYEYT